MLENFEYFWNNYDFEMIYNWAMNADWGVVLTAPAVMVPIIVVVGLVLFPKTSPFGIKVVSYLPPLSFIFVTGAVLNNDDISNIGPFIMALISFFMIIGWLIYTQLMSR